MHRESAPEFQALRAKMESEWMPEMMQLLDLDAGSLPIIWDADFLYGPCDALGQDTYVLCEINVSSVFRSPRRRLSKLPDSHGSGHCRNVLKFLSLVSKSEAIVVCRGRRVVGSFD